MSGKQYTGLHKLSKKLILNTPVYNISNRSSDTGHCCETISRHIITWNTIPIWQCPLIVGCHVYYWKKSRVALCCCNNANSGWYTCCGTTHSVDKPKVFLFSRKVNDVIKSTLKVCTIQTMIQMVDAQVLLDDWGQAFFTQAFCYIWTECFDFPLRSIPPAYRAK